MSNRRQEQEPLIVLRHGAVGLPGPYHSGAHEYAPWVHI